MIHDGPIILQSESDQVSTVDREEDIDDDKQSAGIEMT
jgi:hypothetical protein